MFRGNLEKVSILSEDSDNDDSSWSHKLQPDPELNSKLWRRSNSALELAHELEDMHPVVGSFYRSFKSSTKKPATQSSNDFNKIWIPLYEYPMDLKRSVRDYFTPPNLHGPRNANIIPLLVSGTKKSILNFVNRLVNFLQGVQPSEKLQMQLVCERHLQESTITTF